MRILENDVSIGRRTKNTNKFVDKNVTKFQTSTYPSLKLASHLS